MPFSVLMSVYKKEEPGYLKRALESLEGQTLPADEIVIVKDGELTPELEMVLNEFCEKLPIKFVALKENVMLGRALAAGLSECSHELVARMDSDDIAVKNRFEIQYNYMREKEQICASGGHIAEFISEGEIVRTKLMPLPYIKIKQYAKLRNPMNHMTVMFRKSAIMNVGSYVHFPLLEDYHLWSRLLAQGCEMVNLNAVLVHARIGMDFSGKRGGFSYFKQFVLLRKLQNKWGLTNGLEYVLAILVSAAMTLQPKGLRDFVYALLRKKK